DPAPAVTHGLRSITCVVTCVEVAQFAVAEDDRPERSIDTQLDVWCTRLHGNTPPVVVRR
ncbi:hypothetical protein, partial [Brevibacterium sediminis]|uniref:hypothetical protein n=1 Tax=Brevibacterium sediminis TaxID=1857024 RepID=UPI001C596DF1